MVRRVKPAAAEEGATLQEAIAEQQERVEQAEEGPKPEMKEAEVARKYGEPRSWTTRTQQPVAYNVFTAADQTRKEQIMFRFELPKGMKTPPEEVIQVMRDHKKVDGYPTGLHFENDAKHGPVWKLPSTPEGRDTMFKIQKALDGLAEKIEAGQQVA